MEEEVIFLSHAPMLDPAAAFRETRLTGQESLRCYEKTQTFPLSSLHKIQEEGD